MGLDFSSLYHTYKSLVYNLALNYVQNVEDAEEITQDVFVSVFKNLSKHKGESNLKTWIYRITINRSIDFTRSRNRKKQFILYELFFTQKEKEARDTASDFNHPGVQMENKEEVEKILRIINSLPDNQKTAVILNKIEDKSILEVSEIMGISYKAVESLLSRSKASMQKKLNTSEGIE